MEKWVAGKQHLSKKYAGRLGSQDNVTSPTFALMNEYRTVSGQKYFHFDFYRIDSLSEVVRYGLRRLFLYSGHLCLEEWPEKIKQLLPQNCLSVFIPLKIIFVLLRFENDSAGEYFSNSCIGHAAAEGKFAGSKKTAAASFLSVSQRNFVPGKPDTAYS
jgi:tRNA threonylcarbamoyl adenosine modification protein YjeE